MWKKTKMFRSLFSKLHVKFSHQKGKPFLPENFGLNPNFKLTNFSDLKG